MHLKCGGDGDQGFVGNFKWCVVYRLKYIYKIKNDECKPHYQHESVSSLTLDFHTVSVC